MTARSIRKWAWVHTWSSLVCTLFMLLLCLTGLPLIFHEEIGHFTGSTVEAPSMPADTPHASMDAVLASAQSLYPHYAVQFVSREVGETRYWFVTLGKTLTTREGNKNVAIDARTARVLAEPKFDEGFLHVMFKLHTDLFIGLPGTLFLGFMGILLLLATISGIVLYAPFMRRLEFGTIRRDGMHQQARADRARSLNTKTFASSSKSSSTKSLKWLDTHNLIGIVTLVWVLAVGATGVINTWAELVLDYWRLDQLAAMTTPYQDLPPPPHFGLLQDASLAAVDSSPGMEIGFIAFPGTLFSSPHHYAVFMRGNTPLTARLLQPVLVDAQTGKVTDNREAPWYLTALLISQPLHFGDYGGFALKVIWALFDIFAIIILWTGLLLWWRKRRVIPVATPA